MRRHEIFKPRGFAGHAHFRERALSRRQFLRTAAGVTGLTLASGLWVPAPAQARPRDVDPKPIPGGM